MGQLFTITRRYAEPDETALNVTLSIPVGAATSDVATIYLGDKSRFTEASIHEAIAALENGYCSKTYLFADVQTITR